jgi:HD-like signal output (HDOD) protein/signal transduction histidine kinase
MQAPNPYFVREPPPRLVDRIGLEKLASLPQTTALLLRACHDPKADLGQIARVISEDGGLASRVIQVANSPWYGQPGRITDLRRVLLLLGMDTVKTIAVTSGVVELFSHIVPARDRLLAEFWQASLSCALLARALAARVGYPHPDEAYLVGLLHHVGQLLLLNSAPTRYAELARATVEPERRRGQEQALFGIDHLDLGAWLVERWRLGPLAGDAIRFQHEPTDRVLDAPILVRIVNLAARVWEPSLLHAAEAGAMDQLGIDAAELRPLLDQARAEVQQTARAYGIELPPAEAQGSPGGGSGPFPGERAILAEMVRDTTLIEGLKSAMRSQSTVTDPGRVVQRFLGLLFGLEHTVLFLVGADRRLHGPHDPAAQGTLGELSIPLTAGRSLLADALLAGECRDSFRHRDADRPWPSVVDRQLVRHCGRPGVLALPLKARERSVGVLAAGCEDTTLEDFGPHLTLLRLFLAEAAELILRQREAEEERRLLLAEGRAQALLNARKVRHEANNPLGIISNYLHLLGMKLGSDNPVQTEIEILKGEIGRVGSILLGLVERLGDEGEETGEVAVNDLVTRLYTILQPAMLQPHGVQATLELEPGLPPIRSDAGRLKQVLLNLLRNAVEAMSGGGRLLLRTRSGVLGEGGPCLELLVRDSGPGLPESVQAQLFQPVASTKGGQHAGLGLAITAQLVQELRGSIVCRTGPQGTGFYLLLPTSPGNSGK